MKTGKWSVVLAGLVLSVSLGACASNPATPADVKVVYEKPQSSIAALAQELQEMNACSPPSCTMVNIDLAKIAKSINNGSAGQSVKTGSFSASKNNEMIANNGAIGGPGFGYDGGVFGGIAGWDGSEVLPDGSRIPYCTSINPDALCGNIKDHPVRNVSCTDHVSYSVRTFGNIPRAKVMADGSSTIVQFPPSFLIRHNGPFFFIHFKDGTTEIAPYGFLGKHRIVIRDEFDHGSLVWVDGGYGPHRTRSLDIVRHIKKGHLVEGSFKIAIYNGKKPVTTSRITTAVGCNTPIQTYKNIPYLQGYSIFIEQDGLGGKPVAESVPLIGYASPGTYVDISFLSVKNAVAKVHLSAKVVELLGFKTYGKIGGTDVKNVIFPLIKKNKLKESLSLTKGQTVEVPFGDYIGNDKKSIYTMRITFLDGHKKPANNTKG